MSSSKPKSLVPPKYGYLMMQEAYQDVKQKGMAIRSAARVHRLPESTLRWRLANNRSEDVKRGGPTFFTRAQEEMLAEHCVAMAHLGYGFTRWQIIDMAKNMCLAVGKDGEPTKHWFYGFLSRFPDLKMTHPKKREKSRDDAVNEETLSDYFHELGSTLDKYDIKDKPKSIWNVDETGISLDHSPPKILAKAGSNPQCVTSGKSATTTVIAAVSALGETIPPYVIFKGERMSRDIRSDGVPGTAYRSSPTGWSNSNLFLDFFKNHFLQHVSTRPCLLLYDGHSTHVTFDIIDAARKEDIHLFVLPPHSSHCLQPLDVSVFSPFKKSLSTECHKFLHRHPNCVVVKENLPQIIGNSFQNSMTVSTIMSGYRKTGIFPFDPSAPCVTPPVVERKQKQMKVTRKERKDNRTVKILFQEKSNEFVKQKDSVVETKIKRKTFVPPYGAAITEDNYYEQKRDIAEGKLEKERKREIYEKEKDKLKLGKRKQFTPPFSQNELSSDENKSDKPISTKTVKKTNESKTRTESKSVKKGKGYNPNSVRGKGPAQKPQVELSEDEDTECCIVCGKFQPEALNLDKQIKFVDWGCCVMCDKWVHLKYCSVVEHLSDTDEFKCPKCDCEQ